MKKVDWIILGGIAVACYAAFFHHLGEFTVRIWDESRNGVSALEMSRSNNWLVTTYQGIPDMWSVKPPLYIWLVAIIYKIFGVSELGLRLPSAVGVSLVVLTIYLFSLKALKNRWIGIVGALIILSSMGFPDLHIGRTGDYDALLTLFMFWGGLGLFEYLNKPGNKNLVIATGALVGAVLTKGIAGVMMVPGVAIFIIFGGKVIEVLKDKRFWVSLIIGISIVGGFYLLRERVNPGYLAAVWKEEIEGRFNNNLGSSSSNFWYYWKFFSEFRFQKWIWMVPLSGVVLLITKDKKLKSFVAYGLLICVSYFLLISSAATKNMWYDAPLYPWMSLLAAVFVVKTIGKFPVMVRIFPILVFCFYTQRYIRTNLAYIHRPDLEKNDSCLKYGYLFRDKSINKTGFAGAHLADWCSPIIFYLESNGLKKISVDKINSGDKVLTCDSITFNLIKDKFDVETVFDNKDGCIGVKIGKSVEI
ncbi:MAG: glycosyltransferase family 39 protein [Candidatus Shapirobacteria bacterium]